MRGRAALLAAIIGLTPPVIPTAFAGCHKYSVWNYPWPQRCPPPTERHHIIAAAFPLPPVLERPPDMPLPSLDGIDWGPPCPEDVRARLLLRATLGDQR